MNGRDPRKKPRQRPRKFEEVTDTEAAKEAENSIPNSPAGYRPIIDMISTDYRHDIDQLSTQYKGMIWKFNILPWLQNGKKKQR